MSYSMSWFNLHLLHTCLHCRYLIPCAHIMISQQKCVRDQEMYSRTPEKLISLMPACSFVPGSQEGVSSMTALDETQPATSDMYMILFFLYCCFFNGICLMFWSLTHYYVLAKVL